MLKNDTLENGTSRIGLYESAPPGININICMSLGSPHPVKGGDWV